ncbi:lipocalin-like domain-containing protein [Thauera aromatica]|uniref:Putative hydroxyneurosporene synthase, CrtC-like n=1 Tax=Thauera aromatica K172 TaxID=44139 RepID=A0A2R4BNR3_THAAR|nr:putative hydroxyneurosporene synthase, CrtC-like [Thauera aromatica K172]
MLSGALRGRFQAALRAALQIVLWLVAAGTVHAEAAPEAAYPPVVRGQALSFPRDFGAHPDYRTEWWYITGWLRDAAGSERGFQLTFFRVRTRIGEDNPSRFAPRQLILAHAAIADPASGRLRHAERAARVYSGLVEAREGHTGVQLDDWFLHAVGTGLYRSRISAEDFAFELEFATAQPPVENGEHGFSQKAPDPRNASYYYSRPQLAVRGSLRLDGAAFAVSGHAWLDHEWSSEILPASARGWDWIGINLHDGGSLMAFQMRDHAGGALWHAGTWTGAGGERRTFAPGALRFTPLRHWRSPRTGTEYPVEWALELDDGRRLLLRPLMDDQELDSRASTGAIYWEGAVRLYQAEAQGREVEIGEGYLEMTGYAERLGM